MAGSMKLLLILSVVMSLTFSSYGQNCLNYAFSGNQVFKSCVDLPVLNSFLYYNYDSSAGNLQIAYRHTRVSSSSWVAWAINPSSTGMVGSQALVAFQQTNGTMKAYTSPVTGYTTQLQEGNLSFDVSNLTATYSNSEMIIFATLGINGSSTLNQVWQEGPLSGNTPQRHSSTGANVQAMGTLNLASGQTGSTGGGNSKLRKRNIHGVLNTVGWGILMPLGAIIARYLKVFKSADPAWFYLHISCQVSAYAIGVAGWGTGLKLGSESPGIQYNPHRNIGITLFCLATLQVFALLLRPKPDHKLRFYWNIYHHVVGYTTIILSVVNIFKGFDILNPEEKWKNAYIGVIIALGVIGVLLEAYTWVVVLKRRKSENSRKPQHGVNGANGSRSEDV